MNKFGEWHLVLGAQTNADNTGSSLSRVLDLEFEEHESSYLGVYFLGIVKGETTGNFKVTVRNNLDPDGELEEPEYPTLPTIIHISGKLDKEALLIKLQPLGLSIIRAKQLS